MTRRPITVRQWFAANDWPAFLVVLGTGGWFLWIYLQVQR